VACSEVSLVNTPTATNSASADIETNFFLNPTEPSAKFCRLLNDLTLQSRLTKSVIFSQWTQLLTLLEPQLRRHGLIFERVDGSISIPRRREALNRFRANENCTILLMSLQAGGVGLDLSHATRVYLLDPWW
jgi:SNF2 family DNA or RNA helicase